MRAVDTRVRSGVDVQPPVDDERVAQVRRHVRGEVGVVIDRELVTGRVLDVEPLVAARLRGLGRDGGVERHLDVGDAVVLVPGGVDRLRSALLDAVSDADWDAARAGFGDPELANG